jgi:hypothetical protein
MITPGASFTVLLVAQALAPTGWPSHSRPQMPFYPYKYGGRIDGECAELMPDSCVPGP